MSADPKVRQSQRGDGMLVTDCPACQGIGETRVRHETCGGGGCDTCGGSGQGEAQSCRACGGHGERQADQLAVALTHLEAVRPMSAADAVHLDQAVDAVRWAWAELARRDLLDEVTEDWPRRKPAVRAVKAVPVATGVEVGA